MGAYITSSGSCKEMGIWGWGMGEWFELEGQNAVSFTIGGASVEKGLLCF